MFKKQSKKILTKLIYLLIKKELQNAVLMDKKGNFFKPFDPKCTNIDLEVVALALSRVKRFFGQTNYSVAQHSVLLANYFIEKGEMENAKQALLHEVGEAFMGDLVSPIKKAFPLFKLIEESIIEKVFKCYGISYPISLEVDKADKRLMIDEAYALLPNKEHWLSMNSPLGVDIEVWSEEESYDEFMYLARTMLHKYPKYFKSISDDENKDMIVKFNSLHTGTVVHQTNTSLKVGETATNWIEHTDNNVWDDVYFFQEKKKK